jgi:hypothetical protein
MFLTLGIRKGAADDGMDKDLDMGAYRENYGSGLVNTRISDRENEVSSADQLYVYVISICF